VQMINGLSAIIACVDHNSIAIRESDLLGNTFGGEQQMTHQSVIGGFCVREFGDRLFRNHQNVSRRLRIHVAKGEGEIVFINNVRRNLFADNFAKNSVVGFAHADN